MGYYRKYAIDSQQVLSQISDDMWTLRCYSLGQDGGFRGWYDSQDLDVRLEIDTTLEILSASSNWSDSLFYEELRGACEGLGEIKVDVGRGRRRLSYRILGFVGPGRRDFTLLVGFLKLTGAEYATECPRALRRKEGVLKDGKRAPICSFP